MKVKTHSSDFINSDYGEPSDVLLLNKSQRKNKYIYVYKILNDEVKMPENTIRYMASYYELDKWYSVIKYYKSPREAMGYYININYPPRIQDSVIKIEDLFLDIWVDPDYNYRVLDIDEFQEAIDKNIISREIANRVLKTKDEIIEKIKDRSVIDSLLLDLTLDKINR